MGTEGEEEDEEKDQRDAELRVEHESFDEAADYILLVTWTVYWHYYYHGVQIVGVIVNKTFWSP